MRHGRATRGGRDRSGKITLPPRDHHQERMRSDRACCGCGSEFPLPLAGRAIAYDCVSMQLSLSLSLSLSLQLRSVLLPSPRAAVGRGRGWGVAPRVSIVELSTLKQPPPPTSRASFARLGPRHALRAREEGRNSRSLRDSGLSQRRCRVANSSLPVVAASPYAIALPLRGRVGVGVLPLYALVEGIAFPPPAALWRAIALPSAPTSPASGSGEVDPLTGPVQPIPL